MKLIIEGKTYVAPRPKARLFRQAISLTTEHDLNNLDTEAFDYLVQYVCDVFQNQFTLDELYDEIHADELIDVIVEAIEFVTKSDKTNVKGGKASGKSRKS